MRLDAAILAVTLMGLLATHVRYTSNRYWVRLSWPAKALATLVLLAVCGFLGRDFVSCGGMPVTNLPGCPAHPDWLVGTITYLLTASGAPRSGEWVAFRDLPAYLN